MKKIKYPLIVTDFDGTLLRSDGKYGDKTKKAILKYVDDGGTFVISTGRMPIAILPRAKELGLKGLLSCGQGSVVVDIESGNELMRGSIEHALTLEICEKLESLNLHIQVYEPWEYYSNMDDEPLRLYEHAVRVRATRVTDKPLSQFIKEKKMCASKFLVMVMPEMKMALYNELVKTFKDKCYVTTSGDYFVEICNPEYTKGTAMEYLSKKLDIPLENAIAIGDQWNDLPMLERAGLGIAVANAQAELKAVAQTLPVSNDEDAVGFVIENYAYTEDEI